MRGIYLVSVWLHVVAAMTWVGGMVVFAVGLMPFIRRQSAEVQDSFLNDFGPRLRNLSWVCFAVLAVTGTLNLWMRGVRLEDFLRPEWRSSPFGHLVLLKLGLVTLATAVAVLHERATARWHARWLGRLTLVLGLAIVAVAVMLVRAI